MHFEVELVKNLGYRTVELSESFIFILTIFIPVMKRHRIKHHLKTFMIIY